MSRDYDHFDRVLRDVPEPDGLLARLKRGAVTDETLDKWLRSAEVPHFMVAELREIPAESAVDAQLVGVEVPSPLLDQLKEITSDEHIDRRLCDVPLPEPVFRRLRRLGYESGRKRGWWSLAVSLSLMFCIVGSYLLAMVGLIESAYLTRVEREPDLWFPPPLRAFEHDDVEVVIEPSPPAAASERRPVEFAEGRLPAALPFVPAPEENGAAGDADWLAGFSPGLLAMSWRTALVEAYGSPGRSSDPLPRVRVAMDENGASPTRGAASGAALPLDPAYDFVTALIKPALPWVELKSKESLYVSRPALPTRFSSFAAFERAALLGENVDDVTVRPEEFIAAVATPLAPSESSDQAMALRILAGPAAEDRAQSRRLLITAQARSTLDPDRPPDRLLIAIDVSALSLSPASAWSTALAVDHAVAHLRPQDRIDVVLLRTDAGGAQVAQTLARDATAADREKLADVLYTCVLRYQSHWNREPDAGDGAAAERPSFGRGGSVAALVAEALSVASQSESPPTVVYDLRPAANPDSGGEVGDRTQAETVPETSPANVRLALITADRTEELARSPAAARLVTRLVGAETPAIDLQWFDVQPQVFSDVPFQPPETGPLAGRFHRLAADQAPTELIARVWSAPAIAATDITLNVEFDKQSVKRYRQVASGATARSLLEGASPAELASGQASSVLYELTLSDDAHDDVAVVRLAWRDPATGRGREATQRVSRLQFTPLAEECPLPLKTAFLAAESAEALSGSQHTADRGAVGVKRALAQFAATRSEGHLPLPLRRLLMTLLAASATR